ncbi:hypothetical protein ACFXKG_39610 [Streptomyces sp. NPDC059255]|uniref:hypothetical protein n=1 Tax=Streptomyces sp. NPDC059255 TaxID=3346793 RepID=UPI0036B37A84
MSQVMRDSSDLGAISIEGRPVVLVLDYPGRRVEARVADLGLEKDGYDVRYLLSRPLPRDACSAEYAQTLLRPISDLGLEVHAVLAYCMAAPIAQDVAVLTSSPRIILFDATPSSAEAITEELKKILTSFSVDSASMPVWWSRGLLEERTGTALRMSEEFLFESIRHALFADMIGPDAAQGMTQDALAVDETTLSLVGSFADWLAHLIASYRADFPSYGGQVFNVVSLNHHVAHDRLGGGTGKTIRMATSQAKMLADEETRHHVLEILSGAENGAL